MPELNAFVPDVHFELIPIRNLVANQDYQRSLSLSHVAKTADNFDLLQINPVKVSYRDGTYFVFNGQHTIETIARVSGSRDTPVWCMVYHDLEYQTEADIFAKQQKFVKPLSSYEIFMANIEAGNDMQLNIKSLVESYNLSLSGSKVVPNSICAISALEYIYTKYGMGILDQTLYLLVATWEGDPFSLAANMLKAVAKLLVCYENSLRPEIFQTRLSRYSAKEITRVAKERRCGSLGFAEALIIYYNKKTRYPLRMSYLYNTKGDIEDPDQNDELESDEEEFEGDQSQQITFSSMREAPEDLYDEEMSDDAL